MGITGLIPFLEKASRRANVSEFSGSTVAIDSYCWLHKGAFACADKLVRGETTDIHIRYCLKYVTMLLSKNIKPILVFDGCHLPAKAMTESKRRESRDISKKRAAELLSLGKIDEARSYMRRSVDITHAMALALIQECRKRNVDCIVAPYEADAQLAYLNIKNIAHLVITEDSDLILFGCTKVLFKMDLDGTGTLVDTTKLPLVMKCPIEHYSFDKFRQMCIMSGCDYLASLPGIGLAKARQFVTATQDSNFANTVRNSATHNFLSPLRFVIKCPIEHYSFDKFRQMCIMSGCDYLASLPGIGLAKARQFVTATQDSNFANALRKLPSFFNKSSLTVTDEYRENFLKAEATFKHQYVYDPLERKMVRLTEPDDEDIETALCVNAGELLDPHTAFQLALGNLDPFTLKKMDDWHPDTSVLDGNIKRDSWKDKGVSTHPSIWKPDFAAHLAESSPWAKKTKPVEAIIAAPLTRPRKKVVSLVSKYVAETQDESLTIESLSSMYCKEPASKKLKMDCDNLDSETFTQNTPSDHDIAIIEDSTPDLPSQTRKSPILENKDRSYKKSLNSYSVLKKLSRFPRTVLGDNVVESNFFNTTSTAEESPSKDQKDLSRTSIVIEESPEKPSRNPFKLRSPECSRTLLIDTQCMEIPDSQLDSSQKENSPQNSPVKRERSPILEPSPISRNPFKLKSEMVQAVMERLTEDSVIDNTYPLEELVTPVDSQVSYGESPPKPKLSWPSQSQKVLAERRPSTVNGIKKTSRAPAVKRTNSLPSNQPTLLSKFGFQKKAVMKR